MSPLRVLLLSAAVAAITLPLPSSVRADEMGTDLGEKPIQLALFDPVQVFPASTSVKGFRFSLLYGRNMNVKGLDIGLVSRTMQAVKGLQWGAVGLCGGDFQGWQWNQFVNFTEGNLKGLQSGGVANITDGLEGVQFGMINVSESAHGLQLGFVNITNYLDGLQIGILNVARAKEKFSVLPIVNWSF